MTTKLTLRAVPERSYTRQHHASGYEHAPSISFHESTNSGLYLHDTTTGEVGLSVNGSRRMVVGGITRFESDVLVLGNIIGSAGNVISPIVDFGNVDQNIVPNVSDTFDIGTTTARWSNVVANTVITDDIDANAIDTVDINVFGNLSVSGNVSIPLAFGNVGSNIVASDSNTYSVGTDGVWWDTIYGNTFIGTVASVDTLNATHVSASEASMDTITTQNVNTTTLSTISGTFDSVSGNTVTATSVYADSIDINTSATIATLLATSIESNSIISNVIQTTTLLNADGNEFVQIDLTQIDSNVAPVSNNTFSIGNVQNQWNTVHARSIRASEYLMDSGDPLDFPVDFGNIDHGLVPTANRTFSIGTEQIQWDSIWGNTLFSNVIRTTALLDQSGNNFIPDIDFSNIESNVSPATTDMYSLGEETRRWTSVWAQNLVGNLNAASLYGDLSGNVGLFGTMGLDDGTNSQPSLSFLNETDTGMYRPGTNSIGFSVGGQQRLIITGTSTISPVFGDADTIYYGDATNMTFPVDRLQVTSIEPKDSNYESITQTAVEANVAGYVSIFGSSFESGSMTVRYGVNSAPSVSVVNYAQINASVPSLPAGTYDVVITKNGGETSTLPNGLLVSNIPQWNSSSDLGYVFANIPFDRQLVATDGPSSIVYEQVQGAYVLPPSTTLSATGLIAGNITQDTVPASTSYEFDILARDDQRQETIQRFSIQYLREYVSGDIAAGSLLQVSRNFLGPSDVQTPRSGVGTISVDDKYICPYDVTLKRGSYSLSTFTESEWFTNQSDGRCAFIKVFGDLNIPSGTTVRPEKRKLFTVLHVTGDLNLDGTISMSERGAFHNATTGSGITARNIRVVNGTFSGITNPYISSSGTSGGSAVTTTQTQEGEQGTPVGTVNAALKTGGGGSGGAYTGVASVTVISGSGSSGTSYSGGSGGGGVYSVRNATNTPTGGSAGVDGGFGGFAAISGVDSEIPGSAGGGAGNPGGTGASDINPPPSSLNGTSGTGGIIVVIVDGNLTGSGTIEARGGDGGTYNSQYGVSGGGGSGGGIAVLITKSNQSSVALDVSGGLGGTAYGESVGGTAPGGRGGNGADGTALSIVA